MLAEMSTRKKRLLLTRLIKLMAWTMFFSMVYILFSDSFDSVDSGEVVVVHIGDVPTTSAHQVKWQGLPILVVRRSGKVLAGLERSSDTLRDPLSTGSRQPDFAENTWRSSQRDLLVVIALGTAIDCPVHAVFEGGELTGFVDRCRGWRYDAAGRVFDHQDALRNLSVPPYRIESGKLVIGE